MSELYIHVWSNFDIEVLCYFCPVANWSYRADYICGIGMMYKTKFVGCKVCKRGSEVELVPQRIYLVEYFLHTIYTSYRTYHLHHKTDTHPWEKWSITFP